MSSISFDPSAHPHRRFNPLSKEWVLCSPHRTKRPWQGAVESVAVSEREEYNSECYLCPGNERAGGERTEVYDGTYTFENDYAALIEDDVCPPPEPLDPSLASLFKVVPSRGKCYVICFSPKHNLSVAEMSDAEIVRIVDAWTRLYQQISRDFSWIKYVQIFENKGSMMGCSNPHPHGQVWSTSYIPTKPTTILDSMREFAHMSPLTTGAPTLTNGRPCLLLSYAHAELATHRLRTGDSRVIYEGSHFIAVVPFWASWPFEVMILPFLRHIPSLSSLTVGERLDLAVTIGTVSRRMDNLFKCSFGYTMGLYQAPVDHSSRSDSDGDEWDEYAQLHVSFYPPLLRSSTVKKFLVGFELFAETQRDITPEQAAVRLRDCSDLHYKQTLQEI